MRRTLLTAAVLTLVVGCSDATAPGALATLPAGSCHARHVNVTDPQAWLPDPICTPGATDAGLPADQLCPHADTKRVRPPASYTDKLKVAQMRAYGLSGSPAGFEEDHLIPLELAGAPRDPRNLWPQVGASPNEKDRVEFAAHDAYCAGKTTLVDAQRKMATDWISFGRELGVLRNGSR